MKKVSLAGETFTDKQELFNYVLNILRSYEPDESLSKKDFKFVIELLEHHRDYKQKTKALEDIVVKSNKINPSMRFFSLKKKNKKYGESFSFPVCINNAWGIAEDVEEDFNKADELPKTNGHLRVESYKKTETNNSILYKTTDGQEFVHEEGASMHQKFIDNFKNIKSLVNNFYKERITEEEIVDGLHDNIIELKKILT